MFDVELIVREFDALIKTYAYCDIGTHSPIEIENTLFRPIGPGQIISTATKRHNLTTLIEDYATQRIDPKSAQDNT